MVKPMKQRPMSKEQLSKLNLYGIPVDMVVSPRLLEFEKGEFLCQEQNTAEHILFLITGSAKVYVSSETGENLILCLYENSGVVDDMELFLNDGVYHVTCQATSKVLAVCLPLLQNREVLLSSGEYLRSTCTSFAQSLQRNRNHFHNILYPLEHRLCSYIAASQPAPAWNDNLTRVSEILGVSYRHLSRTLQSLCDKGILRKTASGYVVEDHSAFACYDKGFVAATE